MVFVGFSSQRFEGEFGGKIDKPIALEEFLELSSYMCEKSKYPRPEYKLFGTVVHAGFSTESGHYYAYIKVCSCIVKTVARIIMLFFLLLFVYQSY